MGDTGRCSNMPEKFHALSFPLELASMLLIAVCSRNTATVGKDICACLLKKPDHSLSPGCISYLKLQELKITNSQHFLFFSTINLVFKTSKLSCCTFRPLHIKITVSR